MGRAPGEFEAFGAEFDRRFERIAAATTEIGRLLATAGEISPGAVQDPLPLWLGHQGPRGARQAGRLGLGLLSLDRGLLAPYRAGLVEGGHDPDTRARMGGLLEVVVADDPERATARLLPYWLHQQNIYRAISRTPDGRTPAPLELDRARAALDRTGRLGSLQVLDVERAVRLLGERLAGVPVRYVYAWLSVGGMPEEMVEQHVALWCEPVRQRLVHCNRRPRVPAHGLCDGRVGGSHAATFGGGADLTSPGAAPKARSSCCTGRLRSDVQGQQRCSPSSFCPKVEHHLDRPLIRGHGVTERSPVRRRAHEERYGDRSAWRSGEPHEGT